MVRHSIVTQDETPNGNTMWATLLQHKVRHTVITQGVAQYCNIRWGTLS